MSKMRQSFYKKHRKSLILMITVIAFLGAYIGWYHQQKFIFYFASLIIPINILRIILSKKIFFDRRNELPENILRNLAATIIGFIPIYLYKLNEPNMYIVAYILSCSISAGVISLYSEKYKAGVLYIALINTPFLTYTFIEGTNDHRIISFFVLLYLIGITSNLKEIAIVQKQLQNAKKIAEKNNKSKSEFLAVMSHEIRTPLNGMMSMVQLLASSSPSAEQQDYINTLTQSSIGLENVIDDILSFSKLEAGKVELENISFNFNELLGELRILYSITTEQKNISYKVKIDNSITTNHLGDPFRIKQILSNLISNAIKFTPAGGNINIKISQKDENIVITVSDTGIGVSALQVEKLFQPFSQADMSTTREFGGTGLGLSICKELVELMGGKIIVRSELNLGTIFEIQLPLQKTEFIFQKNDSTKEEYENFNFNHPHKILVVEDNQMNQIVMKKIFYKLGYKIDFANNGQDAIETYKNKEYSLIFMDMQMPIMDGVEATKIILKESKDQIIIGLTANVLAEDVNKCVEAGMLKVMFKPLKIEELKITLKEFSKESKKSA